MISPAKLAANRQNALKSTGPRTDPGKAIAARNSVKHGLLSNSPVIPGEKEEEFSAFIEEWLDQLRPVGALECHLAYQIISVSWRMRRIQMLERAIYEERNPSTKEPYPPGECFLRDAQYGNAASKLLRYQTTLERSFNANLKKLREEQAARAEAEALPNEPTEAQSPAQNPTQNPLGDRGASVAESPAPDSPPPADDFTGRPVLPRGL